MTPAASVGWIPWACAVCGAVTEEQRSAFMGSTIFLSLLPLAMIFGVVWMVYRQYRPKKRPGGFTTPGS